MKKLLMMVTITGLASLCSAEITAPEQAYKGKKFLEQFAKDGKKLFALERNPYTTSAKKENDSIDLAKAFCTQITRLAAVRFQDKTLLGTGLTIDSIFLTSHEVEEYFKNYLKYDADVSSATFNAELVLAQVCELMSLCANCEPEEYDEALLTIRDIAQFLDNAQLRLSKASTPDRPKRKEKRTETDEELLSFTWEQSTPAKPALSPTVKPATPPSPVRSLNFERLSMSDISDASEPSDLSLEWGR